MHLSKSAAPLAALLLALLAPSLHAANVLYFTSTPGSPVGQGQTKSLTPVTASTSASDGFGSVAFFSNDYQLLLNGTFNALPTVGLYSGALRYPFNGNAPGMWFTAPGRGDNQLSGWFNVYQADYNPDGSVAAFAVDFRQYDETSTSLYTEGSVRYNSSIPIPVPEPTSLALLAASLPLLLRRRPH